MAFAKAGKSLGYWIRQIECFRDTVDLWSQTKDGPRAVRRKLDSLRAPFPEKPSGKRAVPWAPDTYLTFPSMPIADPLEFAKATVLETINRALGEHWQRVDPCPVAGCPEPEPWEGEDAFNVARGQLQRTRRGEFNLAIVSGSLIKTLWLQLASYIAGLRIVKRCAAPDCKLGGLMDVTHTDRPNAWTMHIECRERYKKRRRRSKLEL